MTHKRFLFGIVLLMLIMSVFIAGGCGGSSNKRTSEKEQPDDQLPDTTSEEYRVVFEELEQELKEKGLTVPPIHYVAVISNNSAIIDEDIYSIPSARASGVRASTTLPDSEIERMSATLKPYYDNGDVIAIVFPEPETINDVFAAIGEPQAYVDPIEMIGETSEDLMPFVYAVAKRYNGDAVHRFSYILPLNFKWFTEELAKEFSEDDTASENTSDGETGNIEEYKYEGLNERALQQARRIANFHRWAANIDAEMEKQVSYVSSPEFALRSAGFNNESRSGEIFNYCAQKTAVDLSSNRSCVWNEWGAGNEYVSFSSSVSYTIYSYHDFGDNKDYYYVQANGFAKPESYREWSWEGNKVTLGSMHYFDFAHELDIPGENYILFSNAPKNVNRSRSYSDGTSNRSTGSTSHAVGVVVGMEISAEGGKINSKANYEYSTSKSNTSGYTHSATWITEDWEIINNSNTTVPSWRIDFKDPNYATGGPDGYCPHWDGSVAEATKRRSDLDSEWMWQVSDSDKNLSIKVKSHIGYRLTRGNGKYRAYRGAGRDVSSSFIVPQPPHITVASKKFSVQRSGHLLQTELTTAGKWTALSDSSWCQVSPSSGNSTPGDGQVIFINVDPFTQDGAFTTRESHISFKDETTGQTQTIWITQTNRGE